MPIGSVIKNLIGGKAADIVGSVGDVVDKFIQTKEEKEAAKLEMTKALNEHLEKMESEVSKQMELVLKDADSARNREIQISTSDKAPLLNKIISPLLALLILGSTFIFWYMLLFTHIPKDKEILISGITGSLTTLSMGVVSYYFGSSIGSAQKQQQLDKVLNK